MVLIQNHKLASLMRLGLQRYHGHASSGEVIGGIKIVACCSDGALFRVILLDNGFILVKLAG